MKRNLAEQHVMPRSLSQERRRRVPLIVERDELNKKAVDPLPQTPVKRPRLLTTTGRSARVNRRVAGRRLGARIDLAFLLC